MKKTEGRAKFLKSVNKIWGGASLSTISWIACILFLLSLIPIFRTAFYTHPVWDDFNYSQWVHEALLAGGNLLDVLKAIARRVSTSYFKWQGTFSAICVFALMPGVFSDDLYFLTTFIMTGALSLCTYFLIETIVVRWLGGKRHHALLLSALMLFMQIQFMPDRGQGLYWFNGASYYTLFYSFSLVLMAIWIRMALSPKRVKPSLLITGGLLSVAIGGGNYSTALFASELSVIVTLLLWWRKNRAWRQMVILTLLEIAALTVSALAPGNAVRAAHFTQLSPPAAIYRSIQMMGIYLGQWTRLPQIVYMASVAPLAYFFSLKANWRFRWPLAVCILAFLLCASMLTPPYFAMGNPGAGRQINIYHYSFYLLITFFEFYICGWISRRRLIANRKAYHFCKRHLPAVCLVLLVLFSMGCYGYGLNNLSSFEAAAGLSAGEPQQFEAAYEELCAQVASSDGDVVVRNIDAPAYFYWQDLSQNPNESINVIFARYFGAKSVAALPEE